MAVKPTIVFAHGIWADGSCFSKVILPLQAEGYEVICRPVRPRHQRRATSPRRSAPSGGSAARSSWSATPTAAAVITAAGTDDRVAGLVYICALGPDETETSQGQQDKFPQTPSLLPDRGRRRAGVAEARRASAASAATCPRRSSSWSRRPTSPRPPTCSCSNAPGVAWRTKPSWYIVGQKRPDRPPRSRAGRRQAHGRHHLRVRQQPLPHAVPARLRPRRHPRRRSRHLSQHPFWALLARPGEQGPERARSQRRNRWHPSKCSTYPSAATC